MDRETIKIITPVDKHEVVLNAWITGKEVREIQSPFMDIMNVSVKDRKPDVEINNTSAAFEKSENKTIELVVVSVDGVSEGVLAKVLSMKGKDYEFVYKKVNEITSGENFTKPE